VSLSWESLRNLTILDDLIAWPKNKSISNNKRFNAQEMVILRYSECHVLEVADLARETAHSKQKKSAPGATTDTTSASRAGMKTRMMWQDACF
jgi:hypothetical protein